MQPSTLKHGSQHSRGKVTNSPITADKILVRLISMINEVTAVNTGRQNRTDLEIKKS
jgi:hypothetical protein